MYLATDTTSLPWLNQNLHSHRERLGFLLRRLSGLSAPRMNPSLFQKFRVLLGQIAIAKEEEAYLLKRIERVEQEHHYKLEHHQLEAIARTHETDRLSSDSGVHPDRPRQGMLWYFLLWYLFVRSAINQKKQSLTVD